MKFSSISILVLSFCLTGCIATKLQPDDCDKFRSGKYIHYMYGLGHWTKMTLYFEINDSLQTVTREYPIRDTQIFRIKWLSRCEYNLLWINPQTHDDSAYVRISNKGKTYRIKKLTSNYVIVKSNNQVDTLWKNY